MLYKKDEILLRIKYAADNLTYIAYGLEREHGDNCEEANSIHYVANQLREDIVMLRCIEKTII